MLISRRKHVNLLTEEKMIVSYNFRGNRDARDQRLHRFLFRYQVEKAVAQKVCGTGYACLAATTGLELLLLV